jgi:molecular chaperone GrpE
MANDRWPEPGDARSQRDTAAEASGPEEEGLDALRRERDARARDAAEAQERYLRTLADFENFRRRTAREREDWRRQAQEALLREILPALDNFDRALAVPPATGADPAFRTGVELIHRDFLSALERLGVRPFTAVGQAFDPTRHEAVGRVERADLEDQTVVAEPLRGYLFQERVLRPAQVVVAVHPAAAPAGGEGAA